MKNVILLSLLSLFIISCSSLRNAQNETTDKQTFSLEQIDMIMNADTLTPMSVFKISNTQDSILLRTISEDIIVNPNDKVLLTFIKRLNRTVRDSLSLGVGIAAPQVGILKNIIWVQRFDKEGDPFEVYLNPKIRQYTDMKQDCFEGCLSVPDRRDTTSTRAYAILLEYDQPNNIHKIEMIEGFTAVIFQHEIDHLNGILYIDHLDETEITNDSNF